MRVNAVKITELQKEINLLPENKIDDVKKFVEKILSQNKIPKPKATNLSGIWEGIGFEQIVDLEKEIQEVRTELSESILKKNF